MAHNNEPYCAALSSRHRLCILHRAACIRWRCCAAGDPGSSGIVYRVQSAHSFLVRTGICLLITVVIWPTTFRPGIIVLEDDLHAKRNERFQRTIQRVAGRVLSGLK